MSNPYESPKTNDEISTRKNWPVYLAALLFGGLFLCGALAYFIRSIPAPSGGNTPAVTPTQQPVQAELAE